MNKMLILLALLASFSVNAQTNQWFCNSEAENIEEKWFKTGLGNQKALVITPDQLTNSNLIVFIHGDSPFGDPVYQYNIARSLSEMTNAVTVAILRPGYRDGCGDFSEGEKGEMMGDNYTAEVVASIASIIAVVQEEKKTSHTTVIGHSGGAALTALLAEHNSEIADQSILAACPCNLSAWRKSMAQLTENSFWETPLGGLSPLEGLSKLDMSKKMWLYVGEKDVVTPPKLTREFYEEVNKLGGNITMKLVPGENHDGIVKAVHLKMMIEEVGLISE